MRFLCVFSLVFTAALGYKLALDFQHEQKIDQGIKVFKEQILKQLGPLIEALATKSQQDYLIRGASANVNAYVDGLLPKVNQALLDGGLDPLGVPDKVLDIVIGTSTLTEGIVTKLASMERSGDVILTYDDGARKAIIDLILGWPDLELIYKYDTEVLFISITGDVIANVQNVKVHLALGFDFNTDHVNVEALDFEHTGDISLKFTGNLIDEVTNAMTSIFTSLFHDLIIDIVRSVAIDPVQDIVDAVNLAIDNALHPPAF